MVRLEAKGSRFNGGVLASVGSPSLETEFDTFYASFSLNGVRELTQTGLRNETFSYHVAACRGYLSGLCTA